MDTAKVEEMQPQDAHLVERALGESKFLIEAYTQIKAMDTEEEKESALEFSPWLFYSDDPQIGPLLELRNQLYETIEEGGIPLDNADEYLDKMIEGEQNFINKMTAFLNT